MSTAHGAEPGGGRLRRLTTVDLTGLEIGEIQRLLASAFGPDEDERFTDDDWDHAVGGAHFVVDVAGRIVAHASVVERELHVGDLAVRTGYVEAVATLPGFQGRGFGSQAMRAAGAHIRATFELGALGTGRHRFYQRLGWQTWQGPSSVRTADGPRRTPDEDGFILVLVTPTSPPLDVTAPISCDWRSGDVW